MVGSAVADSRANGASAPVQTARRGAGARQQREAAGHWRSRGAGHDQAAHSLKSDIVGGEAQNGGASSQRRLGCAVHHASALRSVTGGAAWARNAVRIAALHGVGGVGWRAEAVCLVSTLGDEPRRPRLLAWVRTLCRHRAFFLECVLQLVPSIGNEPFFVAVLYASLNPVVAGFLRVHEREAVERHLGGSGWPTQSLDQGEHNYEAQGFDFMFSDEDWAQGEFRI